MTAESCSLASRSVAKAIIGFSSIVLLEYNTIDPSKGFSAPILIKADIIETHVKYLHFCIQSADGNGVALLSVSGCLKNHVLRTVPTFVTAHTFCTSRDIRVS